MTEPIQIPFWSKVSGIVARECVRCGHRGWFDIYDDPVMISSEVMCPACGSITFTAKLTDPQLEDAPVEQIVEAAASEQDAGD